MRKPTVPRIKLSLAERTPAAELAEARLHGLVGYQLAQATLVTDQVFEQVMTIGPMLRRVEFTILALLQANPGATARQLSRALAIAPPNIAVWLERLQSAGLVLRERAEHDARQQHVYLSEQGEELATRCLRELLAAERKALGALSPAEQAMLAELLHRVAVVRTAQ